MSLGYDVEVKERDFSSEGVVSRYTKSKLEYPCYIVKAPFEAYKITVLKAMFKNADSICEDNAINLYFEKDSVIASLGKIYPRQVNSFLKLFSSNDITGFFDNGEELHGDYLYVLGG